MRVQNSLLPIGSLQCQYTLTSLHFGQPSDKKVYLQSSLHADELPGMLVLHHLQALLKRAEEEGRLRAQFVVVPVANPIGLAQVMMHDHLGRFDFLSGENFNRNFPDVSHALLDAVKDKLTDDSLHNQHLIRDKILALLEVLPAKTPLIAMRIALLKLAHDADIVLDLHCETEGVPHIYASYDHLETAQILGRCLGAQAMLMANSSGGGCFDEMLFKPWLYLRDYVGQGTPVTQSCFAATVELRGEQDVSHSLAMQDAKALFEYFCRINMIVSDDTLPVLAKSLCDPTPLAGSITVCAEQAGVIAYNVAPGMVVSAGDLLCEVIDPINAGVHQVNSPIDGVVYARSMKRYAVCGAALVKIAGRDELRSGNLLGP